MPRVIRLFTVVAIATLVAGTIVGPATGEGTAGVATPKRSTPARDPVLLVHGFTGSADTWIVMRDRLRTAGYRDREIGAISYDSALSNVAIASQVADAVDALLAGSRGKRVDLVSFSMGAISTRYYVERLGGDARVDAWVSLGGANQGTLAGLSCGDLASCYELIPGSSVLSALSPSVRPDGAVRFATWWSACDGVILPATAAMLDGARNTETACLGHGELTTDARVFAQVERFLRRPHRIS